MDKDASLACSSSGPEKRPQFGNRHLTSEAEVFDCNAWDGVEWEPEQLEAAQAVVRAQHEQQMDKDKADSLLADPAIQWDAFYQTHKDSFFKDRHWLFTEFPELRQPDQPEGRVNVLEVGCGAGNTVFPVLAATDHSVFVFACDFAPAAVQLVRANAAYDERRCHAFVLDIASPDALAACPFAAGSIDVLSCIFCLSAIAPGQQAQAVRNLAAMLAPGGRLLFRDYGQYDLTQLRFKCASQRAIASDDQSLYARGDGTLVNYFTPDRLEQLFESEAGLSRLQCITDNRLIVNRAKRTKMYRVWLQAKYTKPLA